MITKLSFANYGVFNSEQMVEIPFKPCTVFVGPNGSGKSTVLKFFKDLLAKEWFKPIHPIREAGKYFGDFFEVDIEFNGGLKFVNSKGRVSVFRKEEVLFQYDLQEGILEYLTVDDASSIQDYLYSKTYNLKKHSGRSDLETIYNRISRIGFNGDPEALALKVLTHFQDMSIVTYNDEVLKNIKENGVTQYFPKLEIIRHQMNNYFRDDELYFAVQLVDWWTDEIENSLRQEILRELKVYKLKSYNPLSLDKLWKLNAYISKGTPGENSSISFTQEKKLKISGFLNRRDLHDLIGIDGSLDFSATNIEREFYSFTGRKYQFDIDHNHKLCLKFGKRNLSLNDLSQGERKILGILFVMESSDISYFGDHTIDFLYFNEPEISLHPAWQSKLAEVFLNKNYLRSEADKVDFQRTRTRNSIGNLYGFMSLIVETHSEYLIRGLQNEAVKTNRTEDVQIIYFDGKGGIIPIEINKDGTLTRPFGPGFYDESERLSLLLLDGLANKS